MYGFNWGVYKCKELLGGQLLCEILEMLRCEFVPFAYKYVKDGF